MQSLNKISQEFKKTFKESVNEGKLSEDYKNSEWEVYVADENGKEKIVKKAKSKRAGVILYNKLINSDNYYEVGMRVVKESVDENILKQIQQAEKIAKSMAGNMTGAVKGIEKIRRGLSRHKRVKVALKKYNEQEENDYLGKDYIKNESLYNVSQDMKDGKFDVKNPQVHISGYGVTNLKTLQDSLSRKFIDLAKKAKKGDVENLEYLLKKNGVLMVWPIGFVNNVFPQ